MFSYFPSGIDLDMLGDTYRILKVNQGITLYANLNSVGNIVT